MLVGLMGDTALWHLKVLMSLFGGRLHKAHFTSDVADGRCCSPQNTCYSLLFLLQQTYTAKMNWEYNMGLPKKNVSQDQNINAIIYC